MSKKKVKEKAEAIKAIKEIEAIKALRAVEVVATVTKIPHQFKCTNCSVEYENADTNIPECPSCKSVNCANRIG